MYRMNEIIPRFTTEIATKNTWTYATIKKLNRETSK